MVGGIGPGVPYSPAMALAALTATLVTLILAFNTWWNTEGKDDNAKKKIEYSCDESVEDGRRYDVSSSSEEEESTATSYIISTSLTESDRQYNDYELDSVDIVEDSYSKLKLEAKVRLINEDTDILEISQSLPDDSAASKQDSSYSIVSEKTPSTSSQLQKPKDGSTDKVSGGDEYVENHSSTSGVNCEILTSHEHKWIEREMGHASSTPKHFVVVSSGESDVNHQGGTKFEDLGQTTSHFIQLESELSANCSKTISQSKCKVLSTYKSVSEEGVPSSSATDDQASKEQVVNRNARESFDMKIADFEELDEVSDNENIIQQMDNEYVSVSAPQKFGSCNSFLLGMLTSNSDVGIHTTESLAMKDGSEHGGSEPHYISNHVRIMSRSNELIHEKVNDKFSEMDNDDELYDMYPIVKAHDEPLMSSTAEEDTTNHQSSEDYILAEDVSNAPTAKFLISSVNNKHVSDENTERLDKDILNDNICFDNEHTDPDILQHSSSLQKEKTIPDIVPSSPHLTKHMRTSDALFFLYDGTGENSKRASLRTCTRDHNLIPNNPIIALTEKLFLSEIFLSKSAVKMEPKVFYQKGNNAKEHSFTDKSNAKKKDARLGNDRQLTQEDKTHVTVSYTPSFSEQKENYEIVAEKVLDSLGDPGLSIERARGKRSIQLRSDGDDKVAQEDEEEEKEDEGDMERNFVNRVEGTSKTNNGGVHSCLPSTTDVTSDALHHGSPVREVQGSGREKLIGKACASGNYHDSIAASPAEGEKNDACPPHVIPAEDLGAEMAIRSCKTHDRGSNPGLLSSGRQSDKFERLDALVDHLRELAGDSPLTEDESLSLGATTDHDADVSDNVTSTTENSSYVSVAATADVVHSFSDIHKRGDNFDHSALYNNPGNVAINKPLIQDTHENSDNNSEYSQQSFGLLSEYYTDLNNSSAAQESPVSENNISNILTPFLIDTTDASFSSEDLSIFESLSSLSKHEELVDNVTYPNISPVEVKNQNVVSKSDSVTLTLKTSSPLQCKISTTISEKLSPSEKEGPSTKLSAIDITAEERGNLEKMAESQNRERLVKLLERNKKRQERLKHLSKLSNEPGEGNEHSGEQKKDTEDTLVALESAIGHIQQLICKDSAGNFRRKELDLTRRTMGIHGSDTIILGKDHTNTHSYHDQTKIPGLSTVDETQVHHVSPPIEMNRTKVTETVRFWTQRQNITTHDQLSQDVDTRNKRQNTSENIPVARKSEINPVNQVQMPSLKETENANVVDKQEDRWRHGDADEGAGPLKNNALDKHRINRNYEFITSLNEKIEFSGWPSKDERLLDENLGTYEEQSFNIEREPKPNIRSMSIDTERGRCESRDVAGSPPLRLRATERTAVAERQSFKDDISRAELLHPLVMQEQQQNGEGPDGIIKNDSPSKQNAATNTTTPTKVKNLRFKLDPDIYDLPSENGYEDDESDYRYRRGWKRQQPKYQTFSSLELGRKNGTNKEPVKVVSVRTSVVPGSQKIQKMVVKPVCVSEGLRSNSEAQDNNTVTVKHLDIDLRIRLETSENGQKTSEPTNDVVRGDWRASPEKHFSKRQYTNNSSSGQNTKKRSPLPEFSGWNQSLSPVTENCDWTPVGNDSSEDVVLLSTSSDPGQRHRWTPDSGHQSPASWDVEDASFRFKNDFPKSETLESFLAVDNGEYNAQRSDESRHVTLSRSSDNFWLDNRSQKSDPMATISSSNSTPTRPSSLSLSHFRKHLNLPKKRFVPDPEAIERITGYKAAEQTSSRPPLPPGMVRPLPSYRLSSGTKNRIDQLRKRYLDSAKSHMMAAQKNDGTAKFEQFLNQAQLDRANLVTSTPDLAAFEAAVRRQWSKTTMEQKQKILTESNGDSSKENTPPPSSNDDVQFRSRSNTPDHVWMSYVQLLRRQLNRRSQSLSYLETDVDAIFGMEDLSQSMTTLERSPSPESTKSVASMPICNNTKSNRISVSLEESGRTKSEHELRIEQSLQNLSLPDWYKHSSRPKTGFLLEKKSQEKRGWAAAKSLASSTSSLASSEVRNKRSARSLRASRENLPWSRGSASPASADNSFRGWNRSNSGPVLSLALAKAFREPYMGWRARTPSSCASSSPKVDLSPPSWVVMGDNTNTDRSETPLTSDFQGMDEEGDTGISFDGEDILEEDSTSDQVKEFVQHRDSLLMEIPSADDTCDDVINISMDTCDDHREPHLTNGHEDGTNNSQHVGEDTCEDIKNITLDTFDDQPCEKMLSPQTGDDTCDDVLNISTDTTSSRAVVAHLNGDADRNVLTPPDDRESTERHVPELNFIPPSPKPVTNGSTHHSGSESPVVHKMRDRDLTSKSKFDPKRKRYSYNRSIYQNELDGLRSDNDPKMLDLRSSTRSLPSKNRADYEDDEKDLNKVIWIESSFVGSRTTTSIVVLPTFANGDKDKGENTGSNSSVGRPASR